MLGKIKAHNIELDKAKILFEESKKFGVRIEIQNNIAVVNMMKKISKRIANFIPAISR